MDADILFVTDCPNDDDRSSGEPLSGYIGALFNRYLVRAGILRTSIRVESIVQRTSIGIRNINEYPAHELALWKSDAIRRINECSANIVVPLGSFATELITGHSSCDKWNLSVIKATAGFEGRKCMPMLHPRRIFAVPKDSPFFTFGFQRIKEQCRDKELPKRDQRFHIAPTLADVIAFCNRMCSSPYVSVDIETGRGQITCVGFGIANEAMCIPTLPEQWATEVEYFEVWKAIAKLLESDVPKIYQNFIYDTTYFSKYGIRSRALWHDTMLCQKFLNPELPMGLDTIARLFTYEPYWKDEGKDWNVNQGIEQLWRYNAKDVMVTAEAALVQRADLDVRGLTGKFQSLVMDLCPQVAEMCWRGLPVCEETRARLEAEQTEILNTSTQAFKKEIGERLQMDVNPASPVQLKRIFKSLGYRLPTKDNKESTDANAMAKLRQKNPNEPLFRQLMEIRKSSKLLQSYLRFTYDKTDGRMRYSINAHGTETGRFACYKDAFDNGLNAQTIPKAMRVMFKAPEGSVLLQVDLAQAESRFVAWDGPVPKLMEFLTTGRDVHKYVASRIFGIKEEEVTYEQRQLGKKSGHAANYMVGPDTFADQCLKDFGLVFSRTESERILSGYHMAFPEVRTQYQNKVIRRVMSERKLTTPMGRERFFYDRPGPAMEREACAYRPQSTIPDITNCLMKFMRGKAPLLLQVHDSLLFEVKESEVDAVVREVRKTELWHPEIILDGGQLIIPIDIEVGQSWGKLEKVPTCLK
jgi:DNA polymerase-1